MKLSHIVVILAIAVVAVALPLGVANPYYLHTGIAMMINAVLALSLNFILGYVGEKSLGHAAFFGSAVTRPPFSR